MQDDEYGCYGQCNCECADEDAHRLIEAARSIGLCRKSAGTHAEKTKIPVDKIEYLRSYGDGSDMRLTETTDDSGVDHTQEGYGNVGDDIGQRQLQNLLIQI